MKLSIINESDDLYQELLHISEEQLNPQYLYNLAYKYKQRLPEVLEEIIVKDPGWAYHYARDIIEDRFPEAEPYIMKDPIWAYHYAYYIIKDRWSEAEPYIMKSPYCAYMYAYDVIKDRWPEAEPYIIKNPEWWNRYKELFGIK